ncbi:CHRD domain-containing protein [Aquabacterium sp.]|uniref:CHRD domain-containing protein n=1 Tax=Aquabacterium sp. TaxID=1872578 RepID=UPI002C25B201|nr:CHRD domain-containing protein [Aquabacterium sp.]HSW04419.1 CHRD domain-containing protein [Aquabacterium sp.]
MRTLVAAAAAVSAFVSVPANAAIDIYAAVLLGANECSGTTCGTFGDPDGFGAASVLIDNLTNEVSWVITVNDVDPVTAAHIHFAPAGTNGPVRIDFSGQLSGSVVDTDAAFITPTSFVDKYVNVHTPLFPGGAIRGQLIYVASVTSPIPEPSAYGLMLAGLGGVLLVARRRRTSSRD